MRDWSKNLVENYAITCKLTLADLVGLWHLDGDATDSSGNGASLDISGDIGNPTGIAIQGEEISYNPLNLAKTDDVDPVPVGSSLTYTITYDNALNDSPVTNVTIVDTLPVGIFFVSATAGGYLLDGRVFWDVGNLAAGEIGYPLTVTVEPLVPGITLDNEVVIDSDETSPTTVHESTYISPYLPPGPPALAQQINTVITDKLDIIEQINTAMEKEQQVFDVLEELLSNDEYTDLSHGDLVSAKQKIHSAIKHQEQARKALEQSIKKLEDALSFLGAPVEP